MKNLLKILFICLCFCALTFARVSGKHGMPTKFGKYNSKVPKKEFVPGSEQDNNSIKWKRRHKRRKKGKNRRPQRGR